MFVQADLTPNTLSDVTRRHVRPLSRLPLFQHNGQDAMVPAQLILVRNCFQTIQQSQLPWQLHPAK